MIDAMRWRGVAVAVSVAVAIASRAASADVAAAQAAYEQAKALVAQGNYKDACPLFEASYHADPGLGALINLADCHEHVGKLATAWGEFHQVLDGERDKTDARDVERAGYAQQHITAIEPKLSRLQIARPPAPPPGLVVSRDGVDVTALLGVAVPVDAGDHAIAASAPGYAPQTISVAVTGEGATVPATVPALAKLPEPPPAQPAATTVVAAAAEAPVSRWGGVIVTAGPVGDGLTSDPPGANSPPANPNVVTGHGVRGIGGLRVGARARINLTNAFSVEPGAFYHYGSIYMENCSPCHLIENVDYQQLELPVLLRGAFAHGETWSFGAYVGPYVAIRLSTKDSSTAVPSLVVSPAGGDLGAELGLTLDVNRVNAEIGALIGTTKVSADVQANVMTFGIAVGYRL